jgi:hypothetical protein
LGVEIGVAHSRTQGELLVLSLPAIPALSQMLLDAEALGDV